MVFFIILVLQKAGRHMEDTLIASYITLIIGYLILDDKVCSTKILYIFLNQLYLYRLYFHDE